MRSLINLRNICRMCGERYDEDCKAVDIFEPGPDSGPNYAVLMKIHLDLEPRQTDGKPRKIGETCAKLLDEWTDFKKKILETQKELLKLQQRRIMLRIAQAKTPEPPEAAGEQNADVQVNLPSTSRASARLASRRKASTEDGESSGSAKKQKLQTEKKTTSNSKKRKKANK